MEVKILPLKQYWYLLCGIQVQIGDQTFLPTNLNETGFYRPRTKFEIITDHGSVNGLARSLAPVLVRPRLKMEIMVDGEIIGQDFLAIENWKAYYAACLVVGAGGGFTCEFTSQNPLTKFPSIGILLLSPRFKINYPIEENSSEEKAIEDLGS